MMNTLSKRKPILYVFPLAFIFRGCNNYQQQNTFYVKTKTKIFNVN